MKDENNYEIYTRPISNKDIKKFKKDCKRKKAISKNGDIDFDKYLKET